MITVREAVLTGLMFGSVVAVLVGGVMWLLKGIL